MTRTAATALSGWKGVVALLAALGATDVWWLLRFRQGFPLDIDESGYLQFSFFLHDSLRAQGPHAFWSAFQHEGWAPPLLPGTTAVLELVWGAGRTIPSMAAQLLFLAVLIGATFGLTRRLGGSDEAALLAALVVGTIPAVTDFTRTYHMVISSTAMLTLATYLLVRTDRLRSRSWSIAWGVALGLALLSRTMMLALVPSLLVAGLWMLVADGAVRRRLPNLALAVAAAAGTSLVWYATSWRPITDYLRSAGYGSASSQYGPSSSPFSVHYWTRVAVGAVNSSLYLPLAVLVLLSFAVPLAGLARRRPVFGRRMLGDAARSSAIVPALVVAEGYLALSSTRNAGTGFVVPLLPPLVTLAVIACFKSPPSLRAGLATAFVIVSVFNFAMKTDVISPISRPSVVTLPLIGQLQVGNGEGYLHQNLAANADYDLGPPTHWLADADKGWSPMYRRLAMSLHALGPPDPSTRLAPDEALLNASALRLAFYRIYHEGGDFGYVDTGGVDTTGSYRALLQRDAPKAVITATGTGKQYGPQLTTALLESALKSRGYVDRLKVPAPDGRSLKVWIAAA
jgi:hypothetical protein